ncbi:DUF4192 domain-containing protein [Corynebacterium sp. Q4381]|uniref:DUF4192 domain-containing protein n=1 Tax=Corynebacterium sp. Marseille-Q4381 TaxID=3121597 RepID=UPI002FE51695
MTQYMHPDTTLSGPADFIASLPGVLGYYPQESAVIMSLWLDDESGEPVLGPVLRTDLCHAGNLQDAVDEVDTHNAIGHMAVVVTRIPNSGLALDAVEALYALKDAQGLALVDVCWHVSEIAPGTPYSLVFGPPPGELVTAGFGDDWVGGTVASVMQQPTMGALLAQGALPELRKDDTRAFFDASCRGDQEAAASGAAHCYHLGDNLIEQLEANPSAARDLALEACVDLASAPPHPLVGGAEHLRFDDVFTSTQQMERVATMLTRSQLRDSLFNTALDHPKEAGAVMLTIARNFEGVIRANALSVWAVIAVKLKLANWASVALMCAQEEVPGHSLSYILDQLLRGGEHEGLLQSARSGCDATWRDVLG